MAKKIEELKVDIVVKVDDSVAVRLNELLEALTARRDSLPADVIRSFDSFVAAAKNTDSLSATIAPMFKSY